MITIYDSLTKPKPKLTYNNVMITFLYVYAFSAFCNTSRAYFFSSSFLVTKIKVKA